MRTNLHYPGQVLNLLGSTAFKTKCAASNLERRNDRTNTRTNAGITGLWHIYDEAANGSSRTHIFRCFVPISLLRSSALRLASSAESELMPSGRGSPRAQSAPYTSNPVWLRYISAIDISACVVAG